MRIFISGASSGLGAALALEFASPGVTLGLLARRKNLLTEVAAACRSKGATVHTYVTDVTENKETVNAVQNFLKQTGGIEIVIANAGISSGNRYDTASMLNVIDVNVGGVIRLVNAFLPTLLAQRQGQVVAISSVAAFLPLPGSYSASKIAVKYLMDGWRLQFASKKLRFTTIYPGFVETEMTARNSFKMPFIISAAKAARLMRKAIERGRRNYTFPFVWHLVVGLLQLLPASLWQKILRAKKK